MKKDPQVSIIVTTKNSADTLKTCLVSIKQQSYSNIEIIVVDNKSTDQTASIAKSHANFFFNKGPERSAQRNYGARKANGSFLLFIDSDMELEKDVIKEAVDIFRRNSLIKQIVIPEESIGSGFWSKCKALERTFYFNIDWLEAARFFKKITFLKFSGYDEFNTGTEDYDLPQRIKYKLGKKIESRTKSCIKHNEGKLALMKTLNKKFYYAKKLSVYKNKKENAYYYAKQARIINRYKLFFSKPKKLFKNPIVGSGMLIMKTLEFFFGGLGYLKTKL